MKPQGQHPRLGHITKRMSYQVTILSDEGGLYVTEVNAISGRQAIGKARSCGLSGRVCMVRALGPTTGGEGIVTWPERVLQGVL